MVSQFSNLHNLYQSSLTVDTNHAQKFFDEDDSNVLDDHILGHSAVDSGLELSPPMLDSRRDSFAPLFSPKTEDWHSVDMQSVPSNNPFVDQHNSNNPFMRLDQSHASAFGQQNSAWAAFPPLDGNQAVFGMQGPTGFSAAGSNMFASLSSQSIPNSPQKIANKPHPESPAIRSHNELRRGDGIRKKNSRFEIPADRNLNNIDYLITQTSDEIEIKELKQQKRLLRNRQAALDSRQRKKMHTERLEDEKKQFTQVISELEEENSHLKARADQATMEKQSFVDYAETLILERDEMICAHTTETGDLRKKIAVLTEHIQRLEMNSTPIPTKQHDDFPAAFDDMTIGEWDHSHFVHEYPVKPETEADMSVVTVKKNNPGPVTTESDKPNSQQGGLLFMLFLVGAFVMSSRSTPAIPRVSEDVRAASATLLDNVLKDAGLGVQASQVQPIAPQPSGSWNDPNVGMPMHVDAASRSMLADLGDTLTQPTQEQTNEQLFSLSPAQYNGVSSQDFMHHAPPERFNSQGRRSLADALAAMRTTDKQNGAADVYTRSLLWDQIPRDVVRNFAKMVAECNNAQNGQQCNDSIS